VRAPPRREEGRPDCLKTEREASHSYLDVFVALRVPSFFGRGGRGELPHFATSSTPCARSDPSQAPTVF
jgi:hypothetical protein